MMWACASPRCDNAVPLPNYYCSMACKVMHEDEKRQSLAAELARMGSSGYLTTTENPPSAAERADG